MESLLEQLADLKIDVSQLAAFGSDGANSMIGSKNGVAAQLKILSAFLIAIHCVAHRAISLVNLQLISVSGADVVVEAFGLLLLHFLLVFHLTMSASVKRLFNVGNRRRCAYGRGANTRQHKDGRGVRSIQEFVFDVLHFFPSSLMRRPSPPGKAVQDSADCRD